MDFDLLGAAAAEARAARTTVSDLARGAHGVDETRMARIARGAIFEEALLGALHARINELRTVTK
jgi:hypothetical protein